MFPIVRGKNELAVALYVYRLRIIRRSRTVVISNTGLLTELGIDRYAKYRALSRLAECRHRPSTAPQQASPEGRVLSETRQGQPVKSCGTHAHAHVHARTSMCMHATSCGTYAHQVHSSYSLLLTLLLLTLSSYSCFLLLLLTLCFLLSASYSCFLLSLPLSLLLTLCFLLSASYSLLLTLCFLLSASYSLLLTLVLTLFYK